MTNVHGVAAARESFVYLHAPESRAADRKVKLRGRLQRATARIASEHFLGFKARIIELGSRLAPESASSLGRIY